MSVSSSGFALRINGTCQLNEVDCGATVSPYHACCPEHSFCPSQYNVNCCPTSENCTRSLLQTPRCANQTWDLYDNDGFFCCLKGFVGYASTSNSDGCASPGYTFQSGEVLLRIISAGQGATSSPATAGVTSNTNTMISSPTTALPPLNGGQGESLGLSVKAGIGVGAAIGGISFLVVIALVLAYGIRKRARTGHGRKQTERADVPHPGHSELGDTHHYELDGKAIPAEIQGR
ncbi:hypothetical protein B0H63DRAFT_474716 [Podospora didyma]|uniref:Mid2 domain-containing protein n=1 Tax=Podospora didyma TaxID=330526 RepID=A0AAE0TVF2_9PEZI|nr:hypothetical protein B0H63DRAFT_474716 [Podospora didyma]